MNIQPPKLHTRRDFFARTSDGVMGAALTHLLCQDFFGGTEALANDAPHQPQQFDLKPKQPHHTPKATSVIHLFMNGGPSQMDLFDPKPVLNKMDGKPYPGNIEDLGNSNTTSIGEMLGGQYKFAPAWRIRNVDGRCPAPIQLRWLTNSA